MKFQKFWLTGYVIIITATLQLAITCTIGTVLSVKGDELINAVYDIPWYKMSTENQKTIMFILAQTQNKVLLTFGRMAEINLDTFVDIVNMIYTVFMLLLNTQH